MPEANQIMFTHRELLALLIREANLHEGKWVLSVNFGFGAGALGPGPDQLSPTAMIAVLGIGVARATPDAPVQVQLDAALINPRPPERSSG